MPAAGQTPRLMEIFSEALERPSAAGRAAYLDRACDGDRALRREVEELLAAHERVDDFLESPAGGPTRVPTPDARAGVGEAGALAGPYRLLEALGEGGMGVVYVAEQREPVHRRVALKVIKPGMDTKQVVARFEAERQALALMDHPNIAKVHDAGTTPSGRPYFVMELVHGIPITDYCDREQLSIPERLELFVLVCRAVQHAHQKGVIHRDLKPSNILVTVIDGVAVPKVIDFGVAKATGATLTERTLYTSFHQIVGTPLYMSPEQADLSGVDIDTRSDVYSLGVLLYELLTGSTPFDAEALKRAAFDEMRRMIREEEPPRPSTRLTTLTEESRSGVSTRRRTDPRRLGRSLRGELDWVVMKALEKDRARRYGTANALADDLLRHLADRPVEAGPPSSWYRLGKLARRNRLALSAAALALAGLLAGTAVSAWQAIRATRSAEQSRKVVRYLVEEVFGAAAAAPGRPSGRNLTVVEVLQAADKSLGARFADQPLVEAALRIAMRDVYESMARTDEALDQARRAVVLLRRGLGPDHPETLAATHDLVLFLRIRSHIDAAIDTGRRVLAARRRVLGARHPDTLFSEARLAYVMRDSPGHEEESFRLAQRVASTAGRVLGPDHPVTITSLDVLGILHNLRGDSATAVRLHREVVGRYEQTLGPLHAETLWARVHLMRTLEADGRVAEARALTTETLHRFAHVRGTCHIDTIHLVGHVNRLLRAEGDVAGVEELSRDWLGRVAAIPAEGDAWSRHQRSEALSYLALAVSTLRQPIRSAADPVVRAAEEAVALDAASNDARAALGLVYHRLGRDDRALEVVTGATTRPGSGDGSELCRLVLALIRARAGRTEEARELSEGLGDWPGRYDPQRSDFHVLRCELADLLGQPPPPAPGPVPPHRQPARRAGAE